MVWHTLGKRAGAIPYRFKSCTLRSGYFLSADPSAFDKELCKNSVISDAVFDTWQFKNFCF